MKSGFVALIGRPNTGKSTLINAVAKQKITIVSDKPQTTRNRITCVVTEADYQIIFLDTPGVHKPHDKLGEYMTDSALSCAEEVDLVLMMVEHNRFGKGDQFIIDRLSKVENKILAVNKIDEAKLKDLDKAEKRMYREKYGFKHVVGISAKEKRNIDKLMNIIRTYMPEGPQYYPDDIFIDMPEKFIVKEFIREKFFRLTRDEIPYALNVDIEVMERRQNVLYIGALVIVDRDSQKSIVIGHKGEVLKKVGKTVRLELEKFFDTKIYLDLYVKVVKDWRERPSKLKEYGFV